MLLDGVEHVAHAVDPHLVVVAVDRVEEERRPPRACRTGRDVLESEHDARSAPPFPEGRERPQQFALGPGRTLIDDDQIGIEARRGRAQDRPPHPADVGIPRGVLRRLLVVARLAAEPRQRDVLDPGGERQHLRRRRPGHDDDRGAGKGALECLGHEARAPHAAEADRVVRVEQDLGAAFGRRFLPGVVAAREVQHTSARSPLLDQGAVHWR